MDQVNALHSKNCTAASGEESPLTQAQYRPFLGLLDPSWTVFENSKLRRKIVLPDFKKPLALAAQIGTMAEEQWHHPSLKLGWGLLEVEIYTHDIGGLLESDFIFAAKVDHIISLNPDFTPIGPGLSSSKKS